MAPSSDHVAAGSPPCIEILRRRGIQTAGWEDGTREDSGPASLSTSSSRLKHLERMLIRFSIEGEVEYESSEIRKDDKEGQLKGESHG